MVCRTNLEGIRSMAKSFFLLVKRRWSTGGKKPAGKKILKWETCSFTLSWSICQCSIIILRDTRWWSCFCSSIDRLIGLFMNGWMSFQTQITHSTTTWRYWMLTRESRIIHSHHLKIEKQRDSLDSFADRMHLSAFVDWPLWFFEETRRRRIKRMSCDRWSRTFGRFRCACNRGRLFRVCRNLRTFRPSVQCWTNN